MVSDVEALDPLPSFCARLQHSRRILTRLCSEGLLPVACSFAIWFILPDSPEKARFLTKHEKEFIINRLALETGSGKGRVTNADHIGVKHVIAAFKEWKIWCGVVCFWANTIGVYG